MSATLDEGKKRMPLITTYNSDDSMDTDAFSSSQERTNIDTDQDDDERPLSELRLHSKRSSVMQPERRTLPHLSASECSLSSSSLSLSSASSSSTESDTETDGLTETALDELSAQFASKPVAELLASNRFVCLRKRMKRNHSKKERPLSAYALFFKDMLPLLKSTKPDIRFGEIVRLVTAEWDSLTPLTRKEYKPRGTAFSDKIVQSVLTYKSCLMNLNKATQRQCCNPSCCNPVQCDPRWNGQYCSTECVRDHCNLVFNKWLMGKRPNANEDKLSLSSCQTPNQSQSSIFPSMTFLKEDTQSSRMESNIEVQPNEFNHGSMGDARADRSAATVATKLEDPHMPSTLTNRKPLFETLGISHIPLSMPPKESSKSLKDIRKIDDCSTSKTG